MATGIHECKDGHFHIKDEGNKPIWPFWSLQEVGKQIEFFSKQGILTKAEVNSVKKEVRKLRAARKRGKDGRFKARKLPIVHPDGLDTGHLAESWMNFIGGKSKTVDIILWSPGGMPVGPVLLKLSCDFISKK